MNDGDVRVRGGASAEELAAVLAVVRVREAVAAPDPYLHWRATRQHALRHPAPADRSG